MNAGALPPFPQCQRSLLGPLPVVIGALRLDAAGTGDLAFLRALYRDSRAAELAWCPWPEAMKAAFCDSQFDLQHRHYLGQHPRGEFLIISDGPSPLGRLSLDHSGAAVHIIDISLMAAARGHGLGTTILTAIMDRAQTAGKAVTLCVAADNRRALSLYRRLGFIGTAQDGTHIAMRWPLPSHANVSPVQPGIN